MAGRVTWSSSWEYLTEHVEEGATHSERAAAQNYYLKAADHGEPPGFWMGRGLQGLGLELSAEVTKEQMATLYGNLCHPETGEQLGTALRQFKTYDERLAGLKAKERHASPERVRELEVQAATSAREARTYGDVTLSPAKSVSVLHAAYEAAGEQAKADAVWECLVEGSKAAMDYLQEEAGYSRAGYHGAKVAGRTSGRWVDGHDWTVAAFRHHTNRDGEPQLHLHLATLNRVANDDGTYRSIDSQAVQRAMPAAAAIFHRVYEQAMTDRLGVRFLTRPDGKSREVAGMDPAVSDLFSSRRRAIKGELAELVAAYTEAYGREPNAYVKTKMAEHATLKTRKRKLDHPPTRAELLSSWEDKVTEELGKSMSDMLEAVDADRRSYAKEMRSKGRQASTDFDADEVVRLALGQVDRSKAVWTRHDLIGQLDRYLPDEVRGLDAGATRRLLDGLADRALASDGAICVTAPAVVSAPTELRRKDGDSVYEPHHAERYASASLLNTEERLLVAANSRGGMRIDDVELNRFLLDSSLSPNQANVARGLLGSERRLEVMVGPAGAGKSRTLGVVAECWRANGGSVIGLTTSQTAAEVLRGEGLKNSTNLAAFAKIQERLASGQASRADRAFRVNDRTLLVLDEASMIATAELAEAVMVAHRAGARIVVAGDDQQLGSVGAGGGMRLLVKELGAHELDEVHRFHNDWEGEASLRLRDGDASVLEVYDRHGRLVDGDELAAKAAVVEAYIADTLADKRSMVLVSTNEKAAEVSSEIRTELVRLGRVDVAGAQLHDGNVAGVGDLVQTRKNDHGLTDTRGRKIVNRDVYEVARVGWTGTLDVRRVLEDGGRGPLAELPKEYVAEQVELAYAGTVHAAQGRTIHSSYAIVDDATTRSQLYVAMSRGAELNVAHVITKTPSAHGQPAQITDRYTVLKGVLERNDVERSATEIRAEEAAAAKSLARLGPIWSDVMALRAQQHYIDLSAQVLPTDLHRALIKDPAAPVLWALVRSAENDGYDPRALLVKAVNSRELDSADSVAQVLHYRVTNIVEDDALRAELSAQDKPEGSAMTHPRSEKRSYTGRTPEPEELEMAGTGKAYGPFARQLATEMDRRRYELGKAALENPPAWAGPLGPVPTDDQPLERAEWADRASVVAAYREQYSYDSKTDAIGPAPSRGKSPDRHEAWEQAWIALDRPEKDRSIAARSDTELRTMVVAYKREQAWAPPHVAEQLSKAHIEARRWEARAVRDEATRPDRPATAGTRKMADDFRARAARLEEVDEARRAWFDHTAEVRQQAERAHVELDRRYPPKAPEPKAEVQRPVQAKQEVSQAELDQRIDEAIATSRAAQQRIAEQERRREIDLAREERQERQQVDQGGIEFGPIYR